MSTPLLTRSQWGIFGGFVVALIGISLVSPRIATVFGVGVAVIIVFQNYRTFGLGGS